MKKIMLAVLFAVPVILIGFVAWAFIAPGLSDRVVNEAPPSTPPAQTSAETSDQPSAANPALSGTFSAVEARQAGGAVTVTSETLRLENGFSVTNAPDLYVYLGDESGPKAEIAPLKGNVGAQNYTIPAGSASEGTVVWIYCKAFNQNYAKATLRQAD